MEQYQPWLRVPKNGDVEVDGIEELKEEQKQRPKLVCQG